MPCHLEVTRGSSYLAHAELHLALLPLHATSRSGLSTDASQNHCVVCRCRPADGSKPFDPPSMWAPPPSWAQQPLPHLLEDRTRLAPLPMPHAPAAPPPPSALYGGGSGGGYGGGSGGGGGRGEYGSFTSSASHFASFGAAPPAALEAHSWRNGDAGRDEPQQRPKALGPQHTLPGDLAAPPPAPATGADPRPRLQLQPRTASRGADGVQGQGQGGADTGSPLAAAPAPPAAAGAPAAAASAQPPRPPGPGPSIFGAARPREEVLKGRGADGAANLPPRGAAASAGQGRGVSGPASAASGGSEEEQWHTVGKDGRARGGTGNAAGDAGNALLHEVDDPFFGRSASSATHGVALVGRAGPPAGRAFGGGGSYGNFGNKQPYGGAGGGGSYGRDGGGYMQSYGRGRGAGGGWTPQQEEDDGGDLFKRALPTRDALF